MLLFSCPVVSNSLWLHGLQHSRPPCPSPTLGVCPSSCSLHWWCRLAISSSDSSPSALDLSQHQNFSDELAICIRWPKYWNFSFSISPSSEYSGLISLKINWFDLLAVQGTFGVFTSTTVLRHQFFVVLPSLRSSSHSHTWPHSLDCTDLCQQGDVSAF